MQNNAQLLWNYFQPLGWTLNAVAAMAGNMEKESTLSPGIWGDLEPWGDPEYKGYGLVQWTPYTRITNWLSEHGYELTDGNAQCAKIVEEMEHPEIEVTWIETSSYPISFKEFAFSNKDPGWLAMAFLANYERPADPNQPDRAERAQKWYTYLASGFVYVPGLTQQGWRGASIITVITHSTCQGTDSLTVLAMPMVDGMKSLGKSLQTSPLATRTLGGILGSREVSPMVVRQSWGLSYVFIIAMKMAVGM